MELNFDVLNAERVALLVGVSLKTFNNWYMFKALEPDNEYAKMLPEFTIEKENHGRRVWKSEDIQTLINFKNSIPHGRNGVLGNVTQKYYRTKKKEATNEQT